MHCVARSRGRFRPITVFHRVWLLAFAASGAACSSAWGGFPLLYWDVNGAAPGAGGPVATGVWSAVAPNWSAAPGGGVPTAGWAAGSTAVFSAGADAVGAFTVTLGPAAPIPGVAGMIVEEGAVTIASGGAASGLTLTFPTIITGFVVPAASATIETPLLGTVGLTKAGPGMLTIDTAPSGPLTVTAGRLRFAASTPPTLTVVPSLAIAGGAAPVATLDITNNAFVVDYAPPGPSPLPVIAAQIDSAHAGGSWLGPGITTSLGNAINFAVGYAEAADLATVPPIFGTVDATAVLIRFTRYGDANLSGSVGLADFDRLAANFGTAAGAMWVDADFNYDGIVNLGDFNLLAANFGLSVGPEGPAPADWSRLAAAVPEPASLAWLALAATLLVPRTCRGSRRCG